MAQAVATVLVAIIGLIGIYIQTKSNNKLKFQQELLGSVKKQIDAFKKESKEDDRRLTAKLDNIDMENCKRFLIVEMTKLSEGAYDPTAEQKRIIYETKERYNSLGGDSYVDNMFETLQEKKLL